MKEKEISKVIIVTGTSRGIGKATVEYLVEKGNTVIGLARSYKTSKNFRINSTGYYELRCDVSNYDEVTKAFQKIVTKFKKIDVLINNAGSGITSTIEDLNTEEIESEISVNLKSYLFCIKAALPNMRKNGGGHIINVTSTGGRVTFPSIALYDACKHGVESLSQSLLWEVKPWNIHVTIIEPGAIKSTFGKHMKRPSRNSIYASYYTSAAKGFVRMYKSAKQPEDVSRLIFKAIEEKGWRYNTAFKDLLWIWSRKLLPYSIYNLIISLYFLKNK